MIQKRTFDALIKGLEPFDRELVHALDRLRSRQGGTTLVTSRFELCRLLDLEYNGQQADRVDESLARLKRTPLQLSSPQAGFSLATRAVTGICRETDSEKLTVELGGLFSL